MLVFDAEWNSSKDEVRVDCSTRSRIDIDVSCTEVVELRGEKVDGSNVLLHSGRQYRVCAAVRGYTAILLRGDGRTEFGFRARVTERQDGEPLDHQKPASPPMPGADNMLLQIKRVFADAGKLRRRFTMEPEDMISGRRYALPDDAEPLFEEELVERAEEAARAPVVDLPGDPGSDPAEAPKAPPAPAEPPKEPAK